MQNNENLIILSTRFIYMSEEYVLCFHFSSSNKYMLLLTFKLICIDISLPIIICHSHLALGVYCFLLLLPCIYVMWDSFLCNHYMILNFFDLFHFTPRKNTFHNRSMFAWLMRMCIIIEIDHENEWPSLHPNSLDQWPIN